MSSLQVVREGVASLSQDAKWKNAQKAKSLDAPQRANDEHSVHPAASDANEDAVTESEHGWKRVGANSASSSTQLQVLGEPSTGSNALRSVRDFGTVEAGHDWKPTGTRTTAEVAEEADSSVLTGVSPSRGSGTGQVLRTYAVDGDNDGTRWRAAGSASTAEVIPPNNEPSAGYPSSATRELKPVRASVDWKVASNEKSLASHDLTVISPEPPLSKVGGASDGVQRWDAGAASSEHIGLNTEPSVGCPVPSFRDETRVADETRWVSGVSSVDLERIGVNTEPSTGYPSDRALFRSKTDVPAHLDWKNSTNEGALTWEDAALRAVATASATDEAPSTNQPQGHTNSAEWKRVGKAPQSHAALLGEPSTGNSSMRAPRDFDRVESGKDWKSLGRPTLDPVGPNTEPSQGRVANLPPREYDADRDDGAGWKRTGVVSSQTEQLPLNTEPSQGIDSTHGMRSLNKVNPSTDWRQAGNSRAAEMRNDAAAVGGLGPSSSAKGSTRGEDESGRWASAGTKSTAEAIPLNTEPSTGMNAVRGVVDRPSVPAHMDWKRAGGDAALASDDHELFATRGLRGDDDDNVGTARASPDVEWKRTAAVKHGPPPLNTEPTPRVVASRDDRDGPRWVSSQGAMAERR